MSKNVRDILRLTGLLLVITSVVAALLGLVNYITSDKIAARKAEKTAESIQLVLASSAAPEEIDPAGAANVAALYKLGQDGYAVHVVVPGSQADIEMMVGIDTAGTVTGVVIIDMAETAGLGDAVAKESFRDQFLGLSGEVALSKDGGQVDAITGATVSSRAVCTGVSAATACVASLEQGGDGQ